MNKRYRAFENLTTEQAVQKIEEIEDGHFQIVAMSQNPLGYHTIFVRDPYPEERCVNPNCSHLKTLHEVGLGCWGKPQEIRTDGPTPGCRCKSYKAA